MWQFPQHATVVGAETLHPDIPHANVPGELSTEAAGLRFRPDNPRHKPLFMAWEHIQEAGWGRTASEGCVDLLLLPVFLASWGLISTSYCYVSVQFYDPNYSAPIRVVFRVGGFHAEPKAAELAKEIWRKAAAHTNKTREAVTPRAH